MGGASCRKWPEQTRGSLSGSNVALEHPLEALEAWLCPRTGSSEAWQLGDSIYILLVNK